LHSRARERCFLLHGGQADEHLNRSNLINIRDCIHTRLLELKINHLRQGRRRGFIHRTMKRIVTRSRHPRVSLHGLNADCNVRALSQSSDKCARE
jgi:hypothetical protein